MMKALVLLSGGMDSLVCLAEAVAAHQEVGCVHLDYGQKTSEREKKAFIDICDYYEIPPQKRKIIQMDFLRQIGGSSLTDQTISVGKWKGDGLEIPTSYVPFRNSIILSLAVSWAEVVGANTLYFGANWEDSPGYPDCRPAFYEAFNKLIHVGSKKQNIHIETPVLSLRKKEIVMRGIELKSPFHLSWSCYAEQERACGVCDSCALRLRGFRELGLNDPIPYKEKQ